MNPDDLIPRREWTDFLTPQPEVLTWDEYTIVLGRTEQGVASLFELYRGDERSGKLILTGVRHAETCYFTVVDERDTSYNRQHKKEHGEPRSWLWLDWSAVARGLEMAIFKDRVKFDG